MMDSPTITILDTREPTRPLEELPGHSNCVNALAWNPESNYHLGTGGDDSRVLV